LALCKDRVGVVIELKYYGQEKRLEERVVSLVEAAGMQDQVAVISLSYRAIMKMKSLRPKWTLGLLSSVAIGDITRLQVDIFAINARFATRPRIRQIHKHDRKVVVWTVNDPVSMSAMMSKGVDGIITDKPGLAAKVRAERAELGAHERLLIQLASLIGRPPPRPNQ
jgi:glycerophosphoryl diester phosphodiesterase